LITRDVDLPVMGGFRMFGLMGKERVQAESSAGLSVDSILSSSARSAPDVNVLATRGEHEVSILVWNYQDDEVSSPEVPLDMAVEGLGGATHQFLLQHYRVDESTSNSYTAWKEMGSPQNPTPEQHDKLVKAGQLQMANPPRWIKVADGKLHLDFPLPSQGISLLHLSW
jgi:xylan 1,4-beta-xylosidase